MNNFIFDVIANHCNNNKEQAKRIYQYSYLIQYLDKKTQSVDKSSKARGSFANLYALYALLKDYVDKGYLTNDNDYSTYTGMHFTDALTIAKSLPFGEKLQNHAFNNRCNDDFKKYFISKTDEIPILRNIGTNKLYKINESLIHISIGENSHINITPICLEIINRYIELKMANFESFFEKLKGLKNIVSSNPNAAVSFISETLRPSSDARIFEIVAFVIVKYYFINQKIEYSLNGQTKEAYLTIYKVGRTNANDGGIDYIMQPLGRIFQVTEVLDFKKYFLDIDKLIHYPITFIIKQDISPEDALVKIKANAAKKYDDLNVLNQYISCFEEIITIPTLKEMLSQNIANGYLSKMVDELITQCKVEYNIE